MSENIAYLKAQGVYWGNHSLRRRAGGEGP